VLSKVTKGLDAKKSYHGTVCNAYFGEWTKTLHYPDLNMHWLRGIECSQVPPPLRY
jgi:hypothetical protein